MLSIVLLAGGSSSRFVPLTDKNLFPFLGKTLVERQLQNFSKFSFDEFIVIGNPENKPAIEAEITKLGIKAKVMVQVGEGQSGAVNTALAEVNMEGDLLVVNMNDVFEDSLLEKFNTLLPELRSEKQNMLTGYKVSKYFPGGYLVHENGFVSKVVEKPGAGNEPSDYVRLVFDYFHSKQELLANLKKASSSKDDVYETALTNMMGSGSKFRMLDYEGAWFTLKYPWHVLAMMEYFLGTIKGQTIADDVEVPDTARINGDVIIESGVKIFDGAVVNGPVYIGKNCILGNNALVRGSNLGDNCVVGFSSEVARSYFKSNVWLHMNYAGDSIIDNNVSFGSTAITANFRLDEANISVTVKGEKIDTGLTKLGNIIGPNVRIGVGTKLMPGVKIGAGSFIGSGLTLAQDVEANKFVDGKTELVVKDNKVDITSKSREHIKQNI
jgi:bifunctional UDP-N-acetylglucosamine pyrophosphorylase/glucosamine-1-phosphate N-acetyltransferase